jgi:hypothetical protein
MTRARTNSEMRIPPRVRAEALKFMGNITDSPVWGEHPTGLIIWTDLQGWEPLVRKGRDPEEALSRLPRRLRSLSLTLGGRNPEGNLAVYRSDHNPVQIQVYVPRTYSWLRKGGFRQAGDGDDKRVPPGHDWKGVFRKAQDSLDHELRHFAQDLLTELTGGFRAGRPRGALPDKVEKELMAKAWGKFDRANQHEMSGRDRQLHAERPVEFYTRLADLVTKTTTHIEMDQARIRLNRKELRALIKHWTTWAIQREPTITALKGKPTYRKMVSEFTAQVLARTEPLLAAASAERRVRKKPAKPRKAYQLDPNFDWDAFFRG